MSTMVAGKAPLTANGRPNSKETNKAKSNGDEFPHKQLSVGAQDVVMRDSNTISCNNTSVNKSQSSDTSTTATVANISSGSQKPSLLSDKTATTANSGSNGSSSTTTTQGGLPRKTSTVGKFKEKRPGPLNLNPNLNQEIPLDLSVKSAGNVPSGIFNLTSANHTTTLETPRIQWLDKDSSKSRLFSTSTNAGQRVRLSSLMGDSPPITPGTTYMDIMSSPSSAATLRSSCNPHHSVSFVTDSPLHTVMTSPFDLKFQVLDRLAQSHRSLRKHQLRTDSRTPRRSCSTDNLDSLAKLQNGSEIDKLTNNKLRTKQSKCVLNINKTNGNDNTTKKTPISPLVTKSLSSYTNSIMKFSYLNQQIGANNNDTQMSPTLIGKALTPTSLANATTNLLNIHLNSPTRNSDLSPTAIMFEATPLNQQQEQPQNSYEPSSLSSLSDLLLTNQRSQPEPSPLDPLLSAAHCQPFNLRSSLSSTSTSLSGAEHQIQDQRHSNTMHPSYLHQQQQHAVTSLGGSTTLNTPTLISPNQLKTGHICCLPSPTSSPMSSVFELPSPLLMFSQNTSSQTPQQHQQQQSSAANISSKPISSPTSNQSMTTDTNTTSNTTFSITNSPVNKMKSEPALNTQEGSCIAVANCAAPVVLNQSTSSSNIATISNLPNLKATESHPGLNLRASSENTLNTQLNSSGQQQHVPDCVYSKSDLSSLVTPATQKVDCILRVNDNDDDEVGMDVVVGDENDEENNLIDEDNSTNSENKSKYFADTTRQQVRPATVIPQIYVTEGSHMADGEQGQRFNCRNFNWLNKANYQQQSKSSCSLYNSPQVSYDHRINIGEDQQQNRLQRDILGKRALSPKSFRTRVNLYHNERLESCSAPPDVYQRRARAKIKTVAEDSSFNGQLASRHYEQSSPNRSQTHQRNQFPQQNIGYHTSQHHSNHYRPVGPYPEVRNWLPASQAFQTTATTMASSQTTSCFSNSGRSCLSGRSNSAEPPCNLNHIRSSFHCGGNGTTGPFLQNHGFSHSAQHLQCATLDTTRPSGVAGELVFGPNQHHQQASQQSNHHSSQQHSISAGELHRISEGRAHLNSHTSFLMPADTSQVLAGHEQIPQQRALHRFEHYQIDQQQLQPQHLRSSTNEQDSLRNHHHQQQQQQQQQLISGDIIVRGVDQKRQNLAGSVNAQAVPTATTVAPIQLSNQPLAVNLFGSNAPIGRNSGASAPDGLQSMQGIEGTATVASTFQNKSSMAAAVNCVYAIDVESHSESMSSNSADFCLFAGTGSRSSSAASSNVSAKKYHCDQCSKSFTRSDMLTRHKRLHSGDRPFQCNECKQEFSRSDHLSTHMRTHTGEKPYKCKLCSYSACRKDMITRHMKVHNRNPNSVHSMEST